MEEKKKAKEVAARKEEKSKQKKEKKERKQSVLPPVVNAPSSEPLNVHLAKFGLSDLLEKLTEYGVESCADVHAMQEDDIKVWFFVYVRRKGIDFRFPVYWIEQRGSQEASCRHFG